MTKLIEPNIVPVEDDDQLWRRIHPVFYWDDPEVGGKRLTSGAFKDKDLSVYIAKLVLESNRDFVDILKGMYENHGMVSFTAGFARSKGQQVIHDPPDDDNRDKDPAHGLVKGQKSHKTRLEFIENCAWLAYPKD